MGTNRTFGLLTLGCVLAGPPSTAQTGGDARAEDFVAWAAEVAIPIDLETSIAPEQLALFVREKRFVFLGEPDHYIHQKYPFRLGFMRALHTLGWRHLGMEMGHSDGLRFDRFLSSGDERSLLGIGLYAGASSAASAVRNGGFLGMEIAYARDLRAIAPLDERVHYFGFDLDMSPGNGIEDARAVLAGAEGAEELAMILEEVWASEQRVPELAGLLEEIRHPDSTLTDMLPADLRQRLISDLDALTESLRFQGESVFSESEPANVVDIFARREEAMFRLFDAYVDALPADARIVLTGHNLHLSREWDGTWWSEPDTELPIPLWPTIGAHVTDRFPDQVYAIWLVYDHGTHLRNISLSLERKLDSVPETVENLLARLPHEALFLPLASDDPRSGWLDQERTFRVNGGVGKGHIRKMADALVFVRRVSAPGKR